MQLTALFQILERLPSGWSWAAITAHVPVVIAIGCSSGALAFLAWSIVPAQFLYVAKDKALLDYALGLIEDEKDLANLAQDLPIVALHTLKTSLATQYALATDNNRQINKRRERRRSVAGLLTVVAVIFTLVLVAVAFATYSPKHDEKGIVHAPAPTTSKRSGIALAVAIAPVPAQPFIQSTPAASTPHRSSYAGGHKGMVHHARRAAHR